MSGRGFGVGLCFYLWFIGFVVSVIERFGGKERVFSGFGVGVFDLSFGLFC